MPLYDFLCERCNRVFELLMKPKEHPGCCPHCMTVELVKKVTKPAGFILKGDGFYKPSKDE